MIDFDVFSIGHILCSQAVTQVLKAFDRDMIDVIITVNTIGFAKEFTDATFSASDIIMNNVGFCLGWF